MQIWLKRMLLIVVFFTIGAFVWFLLGSTAFFQRGMDIIGTGVFLGAALPAIVLAGVFTLMLIKGWAPKSMAQHVVLSVGLLLCVLLSVALIQSVSTYGWAKEKIESDSLKVTSDNKYEYRIDLINLFQRNSHARLYLKDLDTEIELYIPVDIQTGEIVSIGVSGVNHWVKLEPTDNKFQYVLYTTKDLGRLPEEKFEIDVLTKTSRRVS